MGIGLQAALILARSHAYKAIPERLAGNPL
jgi:hypothetical protein